MERMWRGRLALGALIGAYQEDDSGQLTALIPLAGRTLVEYQVRCAAAAGASPMVVLVERIPAALNQAFERLRHEGLNLILVSDGAEAATRFEAGELILVIGDGVAPPLDLLDGPRDEEEALVPDRPGRRGARGLRAHRWHAKVERRRPGRRPDARRDRGHARRLGFAVDVVAADAPGWCAAIAGGARMPAAARRQSRRSPEVRAILAQRVAQSEDRSRQPLRPAVGRGLCDREADGKPHRDRLATLWSARADHRGRISRSRAAGSGRLWRCFSLSTPLDLIARRLACFGFGRSPPNSYANCCCGRPAASRCWRWAGGKCAMAAAGARSSAQSRRPRLGRPINSNGSYEHRASAVAGLAPQRRVSADFVRNRERLDRLPDRRAGLCRHFLLFRAVFGASDAVRIDAALTSIR